VPTGGAGTAQSPWLVPLGIANADATLWGVADAPGTVGFGLQVPIASAAVAGVQAATFASLALGTFTTAGALVIAPVLSLVCEVAPVASGSYLVGNPAAQQFPAVAAIAIGIDVTPAGIAPHLVLMSAQASAASTSTDATLVAGPPPTFIAGGVSSGDLALLIGATMEVLSAAAPSNAVLAAGLDLLTLLDLAQVAPPPESGQPAEYTIVPSAWSALLANPAGYLATTFVDVLEDPSVGAPLVQDIATLIGATSLAVPSDLAAVPAVLADLGLVQSTASSPIPIPAQWLALLADPLSFLGAQLQSLQASTAARRQMVTALGPLLPPGDTASLGPLTLTATPQGVLSLSLGAATTVASGVALGAAAGLTIDLVTPALDLDLVLAAPGAGIGLELDWNPVNNAVTLSLVPAGAGPPAFAPLQLMPTPSGYIASVAENALLSLLSTVLGAVITAEVLPNAPLVGNVLQALGLTATGAGGQMTVIGLRPAFTDPIAWLLDPSRLGNGQGGFDLGRIGSLLSALPGSSGINGPDGSTLTSVTDGLALGGLPFGGTVQVTATDKAGLGIALSLTAPTVEGVSVTGTAAATFAALTAPAISGGVSTTWSFADPQNSAQQDAFAVSATFGGTITLTTTVTLAGNTYAVDLLPFEGFNKLISGNSGQLLQEIGNLLQTAWNDLNSSSTAPAAAAPGAAAPTLTTFIQAVINTGAVLGITADTYMQVAGDIAASPLVWLQQTFTGQNGVTNITSIANLVASDFAIAGVTVVNTNQVQFQAPLPDGVPGNLTLLFGPASSSDAELSLGATVGLQTGPLDLGLSAQVTVPLGQGDVDLTFGATLALDLDRATSGRLVLTPAIAFAANLADTALTTSLAVYPAATSPTALGTFSAQILPTPELLDAGSVTSTEAWLMSALTGFVAPLVADTVLDNLTCPEVTTFLNTQIGGTSITLGAILHAAGIIEASPSAGAAAAGGSGFQLADIANFANDTPAQLVANALSAFPNGWTVNLQNNNALGLVVENAGNGTTNYGVSLLLNGIALTAGPSGSLILQVGDLFGADDAADSWLAAASSGTPLTPGLAVTLLQATNGSTPSYSFHFALTLGSVGFDYVAPAGQTLFDVEGVSARSLGLRLALAIDQDNVSDLTIGAAVRADGIAIPLGPSFGGSGQSGNPVAQSLLASGSSNSASGSGAVNPTFGVTLAYIDQIDLVFRQDGDTSPGGAQLIWLPVQRSFGPLQCQRIGLGSSGLGSTSSPAIFDAGFDGSISLAGLSVDLQGLTVGIPLSTPTVIGNYGLSLRGLSVSFAGGPVSITGGLIETTDPVTYTGELQVATPALAITALGSFGTVDGEPSLFAYLMVPLPLGGPPFFFVTGLAGGFGYNRGFVLPPVDQVANFPFVSWATNPSQAPTNGSSALTALNEVAPPEQGANWLAAGVRFTSFELLNSIALLVVQFGTHFQIDLIGTSTMTLPQGADVSYVHAELALEVVFDPTAGVLEAAAVLTPNSYVVDPSCHLTGGFAFSSWFSGQHAGDFVLTLGGYYDQYDPPAWYPQPSDVPRLGISWSPGGGVSVSGGAYFALTPSCVMAGAAMQASYSDGNLSAWFSAYLDFLINWHPFYYEGDAGIAIGASYTLDIGVSTTLSVELSATLTANGPPFAGEVTVDWSVVSFTVPIGSGGSSSPGPVGWDEFNATFLPPSQTSQEKASGPGERAQAPAATSDAPAWLTLTALGGRLSDPAGTRRAWLIDPATFVVQISCAVPLTSVTFGTGLDIDQPSIAGASVGIYPMNLQALDSTLAVSLSGPSDNAPWSFAAVTQGAPAALWSTDAWQPVPGGSALSGTQSIPGCLLGVTGSIGAPPTAPGPPVMQISVLLTDDGSLEPLPVAMPPASDALAPDGIPSPGSQATIAASVMAPAVAALRGEIVAAAAALAGLVVAGGPLDVLAAQATLLFQQPPMLGSLIAVQRAGSGRRVERHVDPPAAEPDAPPAERPAARRTAVAAYRVHRRADGRSIVQAVRRGPRLGRIDAALLAGMAGEERGAANLPALGALVWTLPPAHRSSISHDGALPLRIVAIGRNGWPLADTTRPAGEPGIVPLPAGSRAAATLALAPEEVSTDSWAGWHGDLPLLQITPDCLAAHRATVRLQAPLSRGRGRRRVTLGAWSGRTIAARNLIGNAQPQPGWIVTVLPPGIDCLAVLLAPADPARALDEAAGRAALDLTVRLRLDGGHRPIAVTPSGRIDRGGEIALLFALAATTDAPTWVRAVAAADHRIVGVIGTSGPLDAGTLDRLIAASPHMPPVYGAATRFTWIEEAA
jgi:hypothetical protein